MNALSAYAAAGGITLLANEPLSRHTTFRIGGPARYFAQVTASQLPGLAAKAGEEGIPLAIMGNGSNILAADEGFDGLVLRLAPGEISYRDPGVLSADAGCALAALAMAAQANGLTGLEFAMGIPGTVGGAVYMNAGAYDGQISDSLLATKYFDADRPDRGIQSLEDEDHAFGYRTSFFKDRPKLIILKSLFLLQRGVRKDIAEKMLQYSTRRREKQPLELPNAGSVFKRPPDRFAGALIEECGLKGLRRGGAQVSEKHAGFIVNHGGATAADVKGLIEEIQRVVLDKTGVALEREIKYLG